MNALALNKDCSQVVIAGRNVFKVFSIGEEEFTEVCNLRGKNLNLNFSSIDVAWSSIEENTLATAATNGAVVVWNLGRTGRSKQEHVFSDHKRTVNKVSFHLTDAALLISGSQDGTMKCFDLRMKEVARTFLSNTESIRDVQFNPHAPSTFAAVSENGSVQLWDVRRPDKPVVMFAAHSGPVFACHWHPALMWLATASRDKTVKIWDMQPKPSLEHTIYTIASVGHIKWRPQRKYHIASCALVLDSTVNVWDIRRPHVPLAMFAEHRDVTTAIAWQDDPNCFLSTSRDCTLYRHKFMDAAHPALWGSSQALALSTRGHVTHGAARSLTAALPTPVTVTTNNLTSIFRKQPTAGSLSPSTQTSLERLFPTCSSSTLTRYSNTSSTDCVLVACAKQYKITGGSTHELAKHNATVARDLNRHMVAHVWDVVSAVYRVPPAAPPPADTHHTHHTPQQCTTMEEEPLEPEEDWSENQFHNSGVLGLPTHTIYIPDKLHAHHNLEENGGWISAASAHYVEVEAADWTLPEEAFHHTHHAPAHQMVNASSASPGGNSSASTGSGDVRPVFQMQYSQQTNNTTQLEEEVGPLRVRGVNVAEKGVGAAEGLVARLLASALVTHAQLGDVQTAATVMLVMGEHRNDLFPYIEESLQEQWLFGYIELLHRLKLYNISTEVVRSSWLYSVLQWSHQSSTVQMCCTRCGRPCRVGGGSCDKCHTPPTVCAVCHQIVRGVFAWCQGCGHGGHLSHMASWLTSHFHCAAGCGHVCQIP